MPAVEASKRGRTIDAKSGVQGDRQIENGKIRGDSKDFDRAGDADTFQDR